MAEVAARSMPAVPRDYGREGIALAALLLTIAATLGIFLFSPIALEAVGLHYFEPGGGALSRAHPATPLAAMALLLRCLASPSPLRTVARLLGETGPLLLLSATAIAASFAVLVDHTPVSPLLDTFVLPILLAALLRGLDPLIARRLALAIAILFAANALAAGAEVLTHWRLVPFDVPAQTSGDPTAANAVFSWQAELTDDWRARALFGHPIAGGAVTGAFVLCLLAPASRWLPPWLRALLASLCALSLFTFGARAALILTLVFGAMLLVAAAAKGVAAGRRLSPRPLALALAAMLVALAAAFLLARLGLFDRMLHRFVADQGSASTRATMFRLLKPFSLTDLILHPDKDRVATLQRVEGLEFGIESSWLGLTLTYGLLVTLLLVAGLFAFCRDLRRRCGEGVSIVLFFYFVLVSVTASMSGKTTTFAMVVALVLLFLRSGSPRFTGGRAGLV